MGHGLGQAGDQCGDERDLRVDGCQRRLGIALDGYPGDAYFWDTTAYVGLLPIASMLALLCWCIAKRRLPRWPWSFLAVTGLGALLLALPLSDPLRHIVPGTFLRSPSRLLYLSTFSAAAGLGCGVVRICGRRSQSSQSNA